MSKNRYPPKKRPKIPPKGSLVRDLADWKSGDRSNPPKSIKDHVERIQKIPLPTKKPEVDEDGW